MRGPRDPIRSDSESTYPLSAARHGNGMEGGVRMGFFGRYIFDGRAWRACTQDDPEKLPIIEPWLYLEIYDSDYAIIKYRPRGPGSGVAFISFTPRTYFEDADASSPTDPDVEAAGLAAAIMSMGAPGKFDSVGLQAVIREFLTDDGETEQLEANWITGSSHDDPFVESKVRHLLEALELPMPQGLPN